MLAFTPFTFTAGLIRMSGDLWSRNLRFARVVWDAALQQQMAFAGWEPSRLDAQKKPAKKTPAKSRARRKPAAPKPLPDSKSGLDNNDMPV